MVHRGRRSPQAIVRRFIWKLSFRDRELAETVCLTTPEDCMKHLELQGFDGAEVWVATQAERGDVLADTRGRGVFQK